ncbi:MAG: Spy/CpxP family protein refolding chaperone [Cyanobacteria bacterium P01_F01_bin.143]
MRLDTLLIAAISFFEIIPCSANSSLSIRNSSEKIYSSWVIADNHTSLNDSDAKITLFQKLDLTAAQQKKIERIHLLYYPEIIKIKEELTAIKEELTIMMSGNESATMIRRKHQEILNLRQELGKLQLESMLQTREILTLEQRQNFADLLRAKKR